MGGLVGEHLGITTSPVGDDGGSIAGRHRPRRASACGAPRAAALHLTRIRWMVITTYHDARVAGAPADIRIWLRSAGSTDHAIALPLTVGHPQLARSSRQPTSVEPHTDLLAPVPRDLDDLRGTGRVGGVDVDTPTSNGRSSKAARSNTSTTGQIVSSSPRSWSSHNSSSR
jgi:hypothetical protein